MSKQLKWDWFDHLEDEVPPHPDWWYKANAITRFVGAIVCAASVTISCGPLYTGRQNRLRLGEEINVAGQKEEEDIKLQQLMEIDRRMSQMVNYCNRDWRRDLMAVHRDPSLQEQATGAFAGIVREVANESLESQGKSQIGDLKYTPGDLAQAVNTDLQAKKELWRDLTGFKPRTDENYRIIEGYEQVDRDFVATRDSEDGEEPDSDGYALMEKIFSFQQQHKGKQSVPLFFFETPRLEPGTTVELDPETGGFK